MPTKEYPSELAAALAVHLAQQIEDGTLEVKRVAISHEDDESIYCLELFYKRTR